MHLFCKCCKKEDKETPAQVKRLQDEVDCLHFEMTTLSNRLSVLISEKAEESSEVHGEFIQDTTEALLDITGRVERLELLRDETSSRQSQESKQCSKDLRNLASRLDRHEERTERVERRLTESGQLAAQTSQEAQQAAADQVQQLLQRLEVGFQTAREETAQVQAFLREQRGESVALHEKAMLQVSDHYAELQVLQRAVEQQLERSSQDHEDLSSRLHQSRAEAVGREQEGKACWEERHLELQREIREMRSWLKDAVEKRVQSVEDRVQYFRENFTHTKELSESTFHREVTWHVGRVRPRLLQLIESQGQRCFRSPELHFGGQRLVLELQLPAVEDLQAALDLVGPPPAVPLPGVCAVRIWALPGVRLCCQVALGTLPARKGEHLFEAGDAFDDEGRVPFQVPHVGEFLPAWDPHTDSLSVALEILELRAPSRLPADQDLLQDHLSYVDHLAGEALVQQRISQELRCLKAQAVRRVEWVLEHCQRLLERSQPGHFVESPAFACAGLDGLTLRLYPHGELQGPESPASCGLFLGCPEPCALRGTMCIGSRSRGFELSSSKDGIGFAGVGKHCVLERQVDSSDKVLIVLEISEVEQEERSSSTICLRTRHDLAGSGFPSSVQQKRRVPAPFEASVRCSARPSTATDLRRGSSAGARSAGLAIVGDTSWSRLPLKG